MSTNITNMADLSVRREVVMATILFGGNLLPDVKIRYDARQITR